MNDNYEGLNFLKNLPGPSLAQAKIKAAQQQQEITNLLQEHAYEDALLALLTAHRSLIQTLDSIGSIPFSTLINELDSSEDLAFSKEAVEELYKENYRLYEKNLLHVLDVADQEEPQGPKKDRLMAKLHAYLARYYRTLKDDEKSAQHSTQTLSHINKVDPLDDEDYRIWIEALYNLAELSQPSEPLKAKANYISIAALLKNIKEKTDIEWQYEMLASANLGRINTHFNHTNEAIIYYFKALASIKKISGSNIRSCDWDYWAFLLRDIAITYTDKSTENKVTRQFSRLGEEFKIFHQKYYTILPVLSPDTAKQVTKDIEFVQRTLEDNLAPNSIASLIGSQHSPIMAKPQDEPTPTNENSFNS